MERFHTGQGSWETVLFQKGLNFVGLCSRSGETREFLQHRLGEGETATILFKVCRIDKGMAGDRQTPARSPKRTYMEKYARPRYATHPVLFDLLTVVQGNTLGV